MVVEGSDMLASVVGLRVSDISSRASASVLTGMLSVVSVTLPFSSVASMLAYAEKEQLDLAALGLLYEQHQSGLKDAEVVNKMKYLVDIIETSIKTGLSGTVYEDRILPQQSH